MNNKRVIFKRVDNNGKLSYKADSFWSLCYNIKEAELHTPDGKYETLFKNLLYSVNYPLSKKDSDKKDKYIKTWDGNKIGIDYVNKHEGSYAFDFVRKGEYLYKLKYNKDELKFKLVDISRYEKLKKLEKLN